MTDLESTAALIGRIQCGDDGATDDLWRRYLPMLRRWAHGRLPAKARHLADTDDLVQKTLLKTLEKVKRFQSQHRGAFFAYLRRALQNQIYDEIRAATRKPVRELLFEPAADGPSPLEEAVGSDLLEAFDAALYQLEKKQQEAVIMRIELGSSYDEIAEVIGSPSPNAARMVVSRALVRLAELMDVD